MTLLHTRRGSWFGNWLVTSLHSVCNLCPILLLLLVLFIFYLSFCYYAALTCSVLLQCMLWGGWRGVNVSMVACVFCANLICAQPWMPCLSAAALHFIASLPIALDPSYTKILLSSFLCVAWNILTSYHCGSWTNFWAAMQCSMPLWQCNASISCCLFIPLYYTRRCCVCLVGEEMPLINTNGGRDRLPSPAQPLLPPLLANLLAYWTAMAWLDLPVYWSTASVPKCSYF